MNFLSTGIFAFYLCLIAHFSLANAIAAQSLPNPDSNTSVTNQNFNAPTAPAGWRIFGGLGTGYGWIQSNDYLNSPGGTQFLLNAELSYLFPRWELETGIGWFYSSRGGTNVSNLPITLRTRSALFDFSPRYRLTDHWQLGPVLNVAFGADTGGGPQVGQSSPTSFLGLKGVYEFSLQQFPLQLWAQVSRDISITERQDTLAFMGIQIGLPLTQSIVVSHAAPITRPSSQLRIVLDYQKVFFNTNSSHLKPGVTGVLKELGKYLSEHPEKTADIEIAGHADKRGSYQYNLKLSKKRSNMVRDTLLASGLSPSKLKMDAFSYLKPLDSHNNKEAWAKNRRVEMIFNEVTDPAPLRKILLPLTNETPSVFN